MSKPSLVVVLAEDERHQRLSRQYLYRVGYGRHDIRFADLSSGRGSGAQWVLQRYPIEVQKFRSRAAKAKTALVVMIDADTNPIEQRSRQLQASLEGGGSTLRRADEAIVHLIPRRNVETWVLCLSGEHVDEVEDYSRRPDVDALITTAGEALFRWTRGKVGRPANCVPSLETAIRELRRLE